jgi:hypothetical protein
MTAYRKFRKWYTGIGFRKRLNCSSTCLSENLLRSNYLFGICLCLGLNTIYTCMQRYFIIGAIYDIPLIWKSATSTGFMDLTDSFVGWKKKIFDLKNLSVWNFLKFDNCIYTIAYSGEITISYTSGIWSYKEWW